jgi:peptide methionine sulfoxide reductase msrA/msrB
MMKPFFAALTLLLGLALPGHAADKVAYFAGGCFWCTEADFEKIAGVGDVVSGFMGGKKANPSYEDVAYGRTTHRETVKVPYDDTKVSFQDLLSAFWRMHDPTDGKGSFVDRGRHYSSAIYYVDDTQKRLAEGAIAALDKSGKFERPITTEVAKAGGFYPAENYHQDYYKKAATKYKYYRFRSGRDQFIKAYWKDDKTVYQLAER